MANKGFRWLKKVNTLNNCATLQSVPDQYQYKNQEMCDKNIDIYAHALEFISDCYKIQ